jgi:hypothetical protein
MPAWEGQMHVNSPDLAQRQPRLEAFRKTPYLSIPEAGWKSRFAFMTPRCSHRSGGGGDLCEGGGAG